MQLLILTGYSRAASRKRSTLTSSYLQIIHLVLNIMPSFWKRRKRLIWMEWQSCLRQRHLDTGSGPTGITGIIKCIIPSLPLHSRLEIFRREQSRRAQWKQDGSTSGFRMDQQDIHNRSAGMEENNLYVSFLLEGEGNCRVMVQAGGQKQTVSAGSPQTVTLTLVLHLQENWSFQPREQEQYT